MGGVEEESFRDWWLCLGRLLVPWDGCVIKAECLRFMLLFGEEPACIAMTSRISEEVNHSFSRVAGLRCFEEKQKLP